MQIVVGTVFALLYLLVHNTCRPYEDSNLNFVKSISVGQIFCVLYLALISFTDLVSTNDWRFNAVTVIAFFANIPLELFHAYIMPRFNVNIQDGSLASKMTVHNDL